MNKLILGACVFALVGFASTSAEAQVAGAFKKVGVVTGKASASTARTIASSVKKGSKATAKGLKKGSKGTAKGVKKGSKGTASGVKKGSKATAKAGKWVVVKTWNGTRWVYRRIFVRKKRRL